MTTNVFNMQANIGDKPNVGGTVEPKQHDLPKIMPGGLGGDNFNSVMSIQANTFTGESHKKI